MAREKFDGYEIRITMSAKLPYEGDDRDYVTTIDGEILYWTENSNSRLCGRLECFFINLDQVRADGFDYFEILDAHSSELSECAMLFKSRQSYESNLLKSARDALTGGEYDYSSVDDNFIYVRRLEILPRHRGKGLGKFVLNETLTYLAQHLNFDFYAMKPFALEGLSDAKKGSWKARMQFDKFEKNHRDGTKRLRDYYAELGFIPVKKTHLMVCRSDYFTLISREITADDAS